MSAMCYIRNEKGEVSGPFPRETVAQMLVAGLLPACCTILNSPEEAANPVAPPLPAAADASAVEKAGEAAPDESSSIPAEPTEGAPAAGTPQPESPQAPGLSPLFAAVDAGDAGTFMALVNAGEDVYALDAEGHSLRWHADRKGNADILGMLAMMEEFNGRPIAAPADAESPRPATPEPVIRDAVAASAPLTRVQLNRLKKQIQQALDSCKKGYEDGVIGFERIDETVFPLIRQFVEGGGTINELHAKIPDSGTHITFLHAAAWASDGGSAVKWLIDAGADVNAKDEEGWPPLHWARTRAIAELLINAGADVNRQDKDGKTPLHWARTGEVAEMLINAGADVNRQDKDGRTPLHCASSASSGEIAELLIDAGADVNAVDKGGRTPLHCASSASSGEIAELLIDAGADVNAKTENGRTPLHEARSGEIVESLIDAGADVNVKDEEGWTPLHVISFYSSSFYSSVVSYRDVAQILIEAGADVDARDDEGRTPLHLAHSKEMAVLLIDAGADVDARDDLARTPLYGVCSGVYEVFEEDEEDIVEEVAQALIEAGADVDARGDVGRTPLHEAGSGEIAELLINAGADVKARDVFGSTPLMTANLEEVKQVIRAAGGK